MEFITMLKLCKPLSALFITLSLHGVAHANIIGVLTESTAIGTFREDVNGDPIVVSFSGAQISEQFGDADFGSAAVFDTTSRVGPGIVEFQNGNASYGEQVQSVSRTVVDVSFENTGNTTIRPTLNSQITPAGLGLYVSGCSATNLRNCEIRDDGDYDWQDVGTEVDPGLAAVGSRFDFRVVSGEDILFELSGGLTLVIGENGEPNTIVQDFSEIEGFLTDFRQTSPLGSEQQISFDWGATDFLVEFPETLMLAPGEIGNLSYITEVTTFSNAFCFGEGRQACPIAYGAFGDPVGRGGGAGPQQRNLINQLFEDQPLLDVNIEGIDIGMFEFTLPTFENGEFNYRAISGPGITPTSSVPVPTTFGLLALSLLFLTIRTKRHNQ
jgi:hypothetical protein